MFTPRPRGSLTSTRRSRVFIIDGDRLGAESMKRVLQRSHDTHVECDALTALAELLEGKSYDIVLCDLHMPRVNGLEIFSALSHAGSAMAERFVLMTAHPAALRSMPSFGFRGRVLVKPVSENELVPFVEGFLREKQTSSGVRPAIK